MKIIFFRPYHIFINLILLMLCITGCNKVEPPIPSTIIAQENKIMSILNPEQSIALMVPLSGKHKHVGESIIQSMHIVLSANNHINFKVTIFDTYSSKFNRDHIVKKLTQNHIKLIIGPVFTNNTEYIAKIVKPLGINIISFSNNPSVISEGVTILGRTPQAQISAILNFAYKKQNIYEYFVFLPKNKLGKMLEIDIDNILSNLNVSKVYTTFYRNEKDLVSIFNEVSNIINQSNNNMKAIIFPEGGNNLHLFSTMLHKNYIKRNIIKIFGSDDWDHDSTLNYSSLENSFITRKRNLHFDNFVQQYYQIYDREPTFVSYLSYNLFNLLAITVHKEYLIYEELIDLIMRNPYYFDKHNINTANQDITIATIRNKRFIDLINKN